MHAKSSVFVLGCVAALLSACNAPNLIDHVTFAPSANLESLKASLVFSSGIQSQLAGIFTVGDYGQIFINPYTAAEPFEVGFDLNTSVVNDQNYVALEPTLVLPNGQPTGIAYPIVQVAPAQPISTAFNLYAYVDVTHQAWLGAAASLNFLDANSIPAGFSLSQVFLRDASGNPEVFGSVYGPVAGPNGTVAAPGGIAIFANIAGLVGHASPAPVTLRAEPGLHVGGPRGPLFQGDPALLLQVQDALVRGLNHGMAPGLVK